MPFWKQTLHALPYLAAGIAGPAAAGALAGGAGGAAAAGGFSTGLGATGAAETASLLGGYGTVAGVGGATAAGTAAATGASLAGTGGAGVAGTTAAGSGLSGELLRYGVGTAGNLLGSYLQARATGQASDAQQKYLEEALAYAKEQDAINRRLAAEKVQLEASRYADYSGRIAPYLATGSDANTRMASLLGLPSGSAPPSNSFGASSTPAPRITTNDPQSHVYPTPPVSGPPLSDPSAQPVPSFTGPPVPPGAGVPNPYDVSRGTSGVPQTPQTAGGMVHMQAPNGTQRLVPASQVQHWLSKGASVVS